MYKICLPYFKIIARCLYKVHILYSVTMSDIHKAGAGSLLSKPSVHRRAFARNLIAAVSTVDTGITGAVLQTI